MKLQHTKLYKFIKKNQFFYFLKIELFDKEYKAKKKLLGNALKSKEQIKEEMEMVRKYWGCKPHHYIRYELFNKMLNKEEILDYIPPYFHYSFYSDLIYKDLDRKMYDDKYQMFKLLKNKGIDTPEVIAIYDNGVFKLSNNETISEEILTSRFSNKDKIFLKPVFGQGGKGIVVLKINNNVITHKGNIVQSGNIHTLLNDRTLYVIQKGIVQREDISKICADSVNTLRCVTQWIGNEPKLSVCVMRIGRNGSDVDNSSQGGLSVQIDENTGKLYKYGTAELGGGLYEKHPDTGFTFCGFQIEGWSQIKRRIIGYAKAIPEIKELAWDIAITKDNVLAIEINLGYGLSHLQCCCGGMRRKLNIFPK